MDNLKKELELAYNMIEEIPVHGGMVEVMAEARQHLRNAWKIADSAEKCEEEQKNG